MERTMRLANKVAVITGASTGLGASMARTFAEEGAHVVINYPDDSELRNAQTLKRSVRVLRKRNRVRFILAPMSLIGPKLNN